MLQNDWNKEKKGVSLYTQESKKATFFVLSPQGFATLPACKGWTSGHECFLGHTVHWGSEIKTE